MTWINEATEFYKEHAQCGQRIEHTEQGNRITYRCDVCGASQSFAVDAQQLEEGLERFADLLRAQRDWSEREIDALLEPITTAIQSGVEQPNTAESIEKIQKIIKAEEAEKRRLKTQ